MRYIMKKSFIVLLLTLFTSSVFASSYCGSISNRDQRNYCLAKAKSQASYCGSISNRDKRNMCLAEVKGQKSYCGSIQNRDTRNLCLSNF